MFFIRCEVFGRHVLQRLLGPLEVLLHHLLAELVGELVELRLRLRRHEVVALQPLDRVGRTTLERVEVVESRVQPVAERRLQRTRARARDERVVVGQRIEVRRLLALGGRCVAALLLAQVQPVADLVRSSSRTSRRSSSICPDDGIHVVAAQRVAAQVTQPLGERLQSGDPPTFEVENPRCSIRRSAWPRSPNSRRSSESPSRTSSGSAQGSCEPSHREYANFTR